jgi:BirA family biotin operon repressor/biotin-[acetyl-CoA-carboxylase] ligase
LRCRDGSHAAADLLSVEAITALLNTSYLGKHIVYKHVTGSTNDDARQAAEQVAGQAGTVFLAETQTGGKGRLGRQWQSPPGGVCMSVILRPDIPPEDAPLLAIVAGYAVASAIESLTGLSARVKWPNDVMVEDKKLSGILCETAIEPGSSGTSRNREGARLHFVVCGIGINANQGESDFPRDIRESASSIRMLSGKPVDRNALIAAVLNNLESALRRFERSGLAEMREELAGMWAFLNREVCLQNRSSDDDTRVSGVFRGVDGNGRALIEVPGEGVVPFSAGDLSLRVLLPTPATSSSARRDKPPGNPSR